MSSPKKRRSRLLTKRVAWTPSQTRKRPRSKSLPRSTSPKSFANSRSQSPNRARRSRPHHIAGTETGTEADTNPRGQYRRRMHTGMLRTGTETETEKTSRWSCPSNKRWTSALIVRVATVTTTAALRAMQTWTCSIRPTTRITIRRRWKVCLHTSIRPRR